MLIEQAGPAVRAVGLCNGLQLPDDDRSDAGAALEDLFKVLNGLFQLLGLRRALEDVLLVDVSQLDLCNVVGLDLVDAEADHQVRDNLGLGFSAADDGDGLVDIEQDLAQAKQQVELFLLLLELVIGPAADALGPPGDPLLQDLADAHHAGHTGDQHVEVAGEAVLQGGVAEELLHQLLRVHAALEVHRDLEAGEVRLVPDVVELADLARLGQIDHLFDHRLGGGGVGQLVDLDQIALLHVAPSGADAEGAAPGFIDGVHLGAVIDDLAARREIRGGHGFQQVAARVAEIGDRGLTDLPEIKAADIRGHADGDAVVVGDEDVWEGRWQKGRLLHRAVVVVGHVHGVQVDVTEKLGADWLQPRLGVTRGGIGHIAGVDLAEVSLRVHEGVEHRAVAARKAHHRLIDRGVAVGIELHRCADDVGGLRAVALQQAHRIHHKQELAVGGLEAVDLRDGTRNDDAHCIGHKVPFQRVADALLGELAAQTDHGIVNRVFGWFWFRFLFGHIG